MTNISLLSLSLISLHSLSPLYTINSRKTKPFYSLFNSHFSQFFSSIIFSNTEYHSTIVDNNAFIKFLNTPLIFDSEYCQSGSQCCLSKDFDFIYGGMMEDQYITQNSFPSSFGNKHSFFNSGCGNKPVHFIKGIHLFRSI